MTNILVAVLILVQLATLYKFNELCKKFDTPKEKKATQPPVVTSGSPVFVSESTVGQGESSIVVPKTPQRIEWEEAEELRKMQHEN